MQTDTNTQKNPTADETSAAHNRMPLTHSALLTKKIHFTYTEVDGCASYDFQFRGLSYHIWEYQDEGIYGAETNVFNVGKSMDTDGDYDAKISRHILGWPDMLPGF